MDKTALISELQKFRFGSKVICSDGEEGYLSHVGVDVSAKRVVTLGVKFGRIFGKTVSVPLSIVSEASGQGVMLSITRAELATSQSQTEAAQLDAHSTVRESGSNARGTLLLIAAQPQSGEFFYIVAHSLRANQATLLRREYISKVENGSIVVNVPEATFQTLEAYRSDEDLQREVEAVLFDFAPLHVDFPGMHVRVLDSVLYLDGNISSSLRGDIVEDQVSGVPGLLEVKNRLVGDDLLAADLAMALGRDPRTRDLPIGVYPRLGVVRLSGFVHNKQQSVIAEQIAKDFPGARSVINELVIKPQAELLNIMSSSGTEDTEDIVPGKYIRHTK
jgi:osmotically-inducible protein OsmY